MHIDDLPTEILLHILSFLNLKELFPVETVSQRWLSAFNICLSRMEDFQLDWPSDVSNERLQLLLPRMSSLRAINITNSRDSNSWDRNIWESSLSLDIVSRHCRRLAEIDLRPFRVTAPDLHRLCLFCPRLQEITMHDFCRAECLEVVLSNQPCLRRLTVSWPGFKVRREAAECLSLLPASLERLRIADWSRYVSDGADSLVQVARCTQLRQLELVNISRLRAPELALVLSRCRRLERLSLRGSPVMEQESLRSLASCARLRELDLSELDWLRPAELAVGLAGCVRLERLTAVALSHPLEECLPPAGLPALRRLSVRRGAAVTDASLQRLPALLPGLRCLDVSFCRALTEQGLRRLPLLTELRELSVVGVPAVSDAVLGAALPPRLTALELGCADTFAERVSAEAVARLALRCGELRRLTLYDRLSRVRCVVDGLSRRLDAGRDVTLVLYPGFPRHLPPQRPTGPLRITDTAAVRVQTAPDCHW